MGFSRPVRFDETAAILVCKSERDLGRVSKLPRGAGVGVSIVRFWQSTLTGKNNTTILRKKIERENNQADKVLKCLALISTL